MRELWWKVEAALDAIALPLAIVVLGVVVLGCSGQFGNVGVPLGSYEASVAVTGEVPIDGDLSTPDVLEPIRLGRFPVIQGGGEGFEQLVVRLVTPVLFRQANLRECHFKSYPEDYDKAARTITVTATARCLLEEVWISENVSLVLTPAPAA